MKNTIIHHCFNIIALTLIVAQLLCLVVFYRPLMHYKFHVSAVVELYKPQDIASLKASTKAIIQPITEAQISKYRENIAQTIQIHPPLTSVSVVLHFCDRPNAIKEQLNQLQKNPAVKHITYNDKILSAYQNNCYMIQEVLNMATIFVLSISVAISIMWIKSNFMLVAISVTNSNKTGNLPQVNHLQIIKNCAIELFTSIAMAIGIMYFLSAYIVNLIHIISPNFIIN